MRARLVAAGLVALERGEEPSLRAVARAAGVSAMAPYRHFADKAALLWGIAEAGFAILERELLIADAQPDPACALLAQGAAYLAFAQARPALFRLMFAGLPGAPPSAEDAGSYRVLHARVAALAPRDAEAATLACWAAVHGLATLTLDARASGDPARLAAALALIVDAVARAGAR